MAPLTWLLSSRPDAVEIVPGLFVGSAPSTRQRRALVRGGVTCVIDLRAEVAEPALWPSTVRVLRSPITDRMAPDVDALLELVTSIAEHLSRGERVLVHCHAGVGRAATVACAALVVMGWPLDEAYRTVRQRRAVAAPTEVQLGVLSELERKVAAARRAPIELR